MWNQYEHEKEITDGGLTNFINQSNNYSQEDNQEFKSDDIDDESYMDDEIEEYSKIVKMSVILDYQVEDSNIKLEKGQIVNAVGYIEGYYCVEFKDATYGMQWIPEDVLSKDIQNDSDKDLFNSIMFMKCISDYDGQEGDVSFCVNDLLIAYDTSSDWFYGYGNGILGEFPCNYVTPIDFNSICNNQKFEFVILKYQKQFENELDLEKIGEKIIVYYENTSGWKLGKDIVIY